MALDRFERESIKYAKNVLSSSNIRRLCRRGFFLESRTLLNKPWGCLILLDESQPGEKPTPKTNILHTSLQLNSSLLLLFTYSSDEVKSYRTIKTISMNGGGLNIQNVNLEKANLQSVLPALLLSCLRKRKKIAASKKLRLSQPLFSESRSQQ